MLFAPLDRWRAVFGRHLASEPRPHGRLRRGRRATAHDTRRQPSVALENARLVDETRQRAAELAIVNEVGQATASQLDLDALIELAGDQMRTTFRADIVVRRAARPATRPDRASRTTSRTRQARTAGPLPLGEGLTSQILLSRQPLLLNRADAIRRDRTRQGVGNAPSSRTWACRSWSATRRSARSASRASTRRAGSARPTCGCCRRSPRTSARRSRTPSSTESRSAARPRWRRWPRSAARSPRRWTSSGPARAHRRARARTLLEADIERRVPGRARRPDVPGDRRRRRYRRRRSRPTPIDAGRGHHRHARRRGARRGRQRRRCTTRAASRSPGRRPTSDGAADGRAADRPRRASTA